MGGPRREVDLLAVDAALRRALSDGPFSRALRLAREKAGLTPKELTAQLRRRRVDLKLSTLYAWERGSNRPERPSSMQAIREIERVLGYPETTLSRLLGPRRPRGTPGGGRGGARRPAAGDEHPAGEADPPAAGKPPGYDELLAQIGEDPGLGHFTLDLHEFHQVGEQRTPVRHRTRQLIEARSDGLQRYVYVFDLRSLEDGAGRVEAVEGCRVGRVWSSGDTLRAVELLFDRELRPGQTHLFEYETHLVYRVAPPPEYRRYQRRRLRQLLIQVTFAASALPARVFRSRWASYDGEPEDLYPLVPTDGRVHFHDDRPAPGEIVGIRWEWE